METGKFPESFIKVGLPMHSLIETFPKQLSSRYQHAGTWSACVGATIGAREESEMLKKSSVVAAIITVAGGLLLWYLNRMLPAPAPVAPVRQTGDITTSGEKSPVINGDNNKIEIK